jgi:DNA/RNA endonuclease YhcR with UshA esterase domain
MKRLTFLPLIRFLILLLTAVLTFYGCANAQVLTVSEILNHPDKYHLKTVQVKGEVLDVKYKVSKRGNPYAVFVLSDGKASIKVFTFGTPEINVGDKVMVKGTFYKVKYVGRYTFNNEIDASKGLIKRE